MEPLNINSLMSYFKKLLKCRECKIEGICLPQLRPPGPDYKPHGIVFVQINPGFAGSQDPKQIQKNYTNTKNRKIALDKIDSTERLIQSQIKFEKNPSYANYDSMATLFQKAREVQWGWPPGKFRKTIEVHGVSLKEIAIINLAQCPVRDNMYNSYLLSNCWKYQTSELINILQPTAIVAQGDRIFKFLSSKGLEPEIKLIKGVHHASRKSKEINQQVFSEARHAIESLNLQSFKAP